MKLEQFLSGVPGMESDRSFSGVNPAKMLEEDIELVKFQNRLKKVMKAQVFSAKSLVTQKTDEFFDCCEQELKSMVEKEVLQVREDLKDDEDGLLKELLLKKVEISV